MADPPIVFTIRCDCCEGDERCVSIGHILTGDEPDRMLMSIDLSLVPRVGRFGLRERIGMAWHMLTTGRSVLRSNILFERSTVEAWARKLDEVAGRMRVIDDTQG